MKRILVLNPFGIGDVIFTMSLVECLRRAHPDGWIAFLCNERTEALVRMNQSIDQTIVFNRDVFRSRARKSLFGFVKEVQAFLGLVRSLQVDTLVDLSLGRQYSFFSMLIGIRRRIGFNFKRRGIFLTHRVNLKGYNGTPVAQTQMQLLGFLGVEKPKSAVKLSLAVPESAIHQCERMLSGQGIAHGEKIMLVAPGGGRSWGENAFYKQWGPERFAQAVNRFAQGTPTKVIVVGDTDEAGLIQAVSTRLEMPHFDLIGKPLDLVGAFLLRSGLLLCNDSGLLHLGHALGIRTVSIFGPVDERVYGPWGSDAPHRVLTAPVPCRPCYKDFHFPPCPHNRRCLEEISVEKVLEAMNEFKHE